MKDVHGAPLLSTFPNGQAPLYPALLYSILLCSALLYPTLLYYFTLSHSTHGEAPLLVEEVLGAPFHMEDVPGASLPPLLVEEMRGIQANDQAPLYPALLYTTLL